jgi:polyisoprenoid-binding protein YceI
MEATAVKTKWAIDPMHSELTFKVKHLMISNVKGEFRKFDAVVESNGKDFSGATVKATIDASSIDTNSGDRDVHLKSADFFDAVNHKDLVFEGTTEKSGNGYQLKGNLTMKGITKPVTLDVEFGGMMKDPYGNEKAGFSFSGKINRKEWGLNWNAALETGGVMVSDEVKINGEVQLIRNK